jgi:hypothetical protein
MEISPPPKKNNKNCPAAAALITENAFAVDDFVSFDTK